MAYNKFQKSIIKTIAEFHPNGIDVLFKELFQEIMEKNLEGCGIIMNESNIFINSNNFIEDKSKIFELFFLFEYLIENNLFKFIESERTKKFFEKDYKYQIYSQENIIRINLDTYTLNLIYNNLYSDFYISTELKEIKKNKFLTNEQISLKLTRKTFWVSIVVSIITTLTTIFGFYWQWYIANKVNTVIEFKNPEQLKNASSTTIINMGKK